MYNNFTVTFQSQPSTVRTKDKNPIYVQEDNSHLSKRSHSKKARHLAGR